MTRCIRFHRFDRGLVRGVSEGKGCVARRAGYPVCGILHGFVIGIFLLFQSVYGLALCKISDCILHLYAVCVLYGAGSGKRYHAAGDVPSSVFQPSVRHRSVFRVFDRQRNKGGKGLSFRRRRILAGTITDSHSGVPALGYIE